jgi:hypothetical protein
VEVEFEMPTLAIIYDLATGLLESWDAYTGQQDIEATVTDRSLPQLLVTFGLAAHAHRLARPALNLLNAGLVIESAPIVRSMYECALTAQWIAQVEGAEAAFYNQQTRMRKTMLMSIAGLNLRQVDPEQIASSLLEIESAEALETKAAHSFEAICNSLTPGGAQAYTQYRLMCSYSHPSALLVDHYFQEIEGFPRVGRRDEPEQPQPMSWAVFVLGSLVWAGQAVEYSDPNRTRENDLESVASRIGIARVLSPTVPAPGKTGGPALN